VEVDLVYYRRRSAEERTAAAASHNVKVREIHLELAAAYDQRAATLEAHNGNSTLRLVPAAYLPKLAGVSASHRATASLTNKVNFR